MHLKKKWYNTHYMTIVISVNISEYQWFNCAFLG